MRLQDIYDYLDKISPFELQEQWDNSGLIVGDYNLQVSQIVVSLDIDFEMITEAKEGTLFVIHHPLIFDRLSKLDLAKYPANILEKLILKKQSLIAMHTNFDKTHLNTYVFETILGLKIDKKMPFLCSCKGEWEYQSLLQLIKEKLDLPMLKIVAQKEKITSLSMCTGSGASLIDDVETDCFLTGDIKYHDAMKAMSQNLMMIDIGHYESEKFFSEILYEELKVLPILAIMANSKNPFQFETGS